MLRVRVRPGRRVLMRTAPMSAPSARHAEPNPCEKAPLANAKCEAPKYAALLRFPALLVGMGSLETGALLLRNSPVAGA